MSVLPQLQGAGGPRDEAVIASALRTKQWKLVANKQELYNLKADPMEEVNVFNRRRGKVRQLREIYRQRTSELKKKGRDLIEKDAARKPESVELTPEEVESLRALGYLH
jgi:hypothetical protein